MFCKCAAAFLSVMMASHLCTGQGSAEAPAGPESLAPQHIVRLNSLISPNGALASPVELLGYDLEAGGAPLTGMPLAYEEGSRLSVDLYWIPREPIAGLSAVVRLTGSGPVLEEVCPIDTSGWQTGVVFRQRVDLTHPRGRYSGVGTLTLALRADDSAASDYVLETKPIFVRTSVFRSKVEKSRLQDQLGEGVVALGAAFRLGKGASVSVEVPAELQRDYTGLVLISGTGYDGDPQPGGVVCAMEISGSADFECPIRNGRETGPNERTRYDAMGGDKTGLSVFSASDRNMDYSAALFFPQPIRPSRITFKYLHTRGVIDVKEVALLRNR